MITSQLLRGTNSIKQLRGFPIIRRFYSNINSFSKTGSSQEELSHFKVLSTDWWNTNGSQRILHLMNLARLDFIRDNLNKTLKIEHQQEKDIFIPGYDYNQFLPKNISKIIKQDLNNELQKMLNEKQYSVLDIGCGGGILSESLARLPFIKSVIGIDLTPNCVDVAKEHASKDPLLKDKLTYKLCDLTEVEETYDIITCFEMLEHVNDPYEILKHAWKKLNSKGILFLSTINRDLVSWFTTIFVAEYLAGLVPVGTHTWSKFVKSSEVINWFDKHQFRKYKVLDLKGTMYVPSKGWVNHDCSSIGNYFMAIQKL